MPMGGWVDETRDWTGLLVTCFVFISDVFRVWMDVDIAAETPMRYETLDYTSAK